MGFLLRELGKRFQLYNASGVPERFDWLELPGPVLTSLEEMKEFSPEPLPCTGLRRASPGGSDPGGGHGPGPNRERRPPSGESHVRRGELGGPGPGGGGRDGGSPGRGFGRGLARSLGRGPVSGPGNGFRPLQLRQHQARDHGDGRRDSAPGTEPGGIHRQAGKSLARAQIAFMAGGAGKGPLSSGQRHRGAESSRIVC